MLVPRLKKWGSDYLEMSRARPPSSLPNSTSPKSKKRKTKRHSTSNITRSGCSPIDTTRTLKRQTLCSKLTLIRAMATQSPHPPCFCSVCIAFLFPSDTYSDPSHQLCPRLIRDNNNNTKNPQKPRPRHWNFRPPTERVLKSGCCLSPGIPARSLLFFFFPAPLSLNICFVLG